MSQGVEVYDPTTGSVVWSSNQRQTNVQVYAYFDLASNSNPTFTCADADDSSQVLITFKSTNFNLVPSYEGVKVTNRTSTSFNLSGNTQTGWVIAVRIR
jgi:hypothetical protein